MVLKTKIMKSRLLFFSILILVLITFCNCGRAFYYNNNESNDCFSIDEVDDIYIRKLYSQENEFLGNELTKETNNIAGEENSLIEIQYLIIKKNNQVLYVTSTPSRYVYDKEDSYLIDRKYPNAFFFNKFYFGKRTKKNLVDREITFENNDLKQVWELKLDSLNELQLVSVDEIKKKNDTDNSLTMKVVNSFKDNFVFKKVNYPFHIGFKSPFIDEEQSKTKTFDYKRIISKRICFIRNFENKEIIEQILIQFDNPVLGEEYKTIQFKKKRIPFYLKD